MRYCATHPDSLDDVVAMRLTLPLTDQIQHAQQGRVRWNTDKTYIKTCVYTWQDVLKPKTQNHQPVYILQSADLFCKMFVEMVQP